MLTDFLEMTTIVIGNTGLGNVTLRRYNGMPLPSDIWGVAADIDVDYVMTDTTTNPTVPKLERGVGVILDGATLARSRPRVTWDGTIFDEDLPAALNFGATPPHGNVRIRCAPASDQFVQGPPAIMIPATGTFTGFLPTSTLCGAPGTTSWVELVAGWQYYIPYLCGARGTVTGMAAYCAEVVGNDYFTLGIYGVHPVDGTPGRCITRSAPILQNAVGLLKDIAPLSWTPRPGPLSLKQGWYYLGFLSPLVNFRMAVSSRTQLAGPSPMGVYDQYGWGAIMRRNSGGADIELPPTRPGGAYGNPASLITALNVPTVMLGFAN